MNLRQPGFLSDTLPALILSALLLVSAIAVAVVMFAPSDRDAIVKALTREAVQIIDVAQEYPDQFTVMTPDSTVLGPFAGLRFDRIGYFERISPNALTHYTETGEYTLLVPADGESFTLIARGAQDIELRWQGVTQDSIPEPQ